MLILLKKKNDNSEVCPFFFRINEGTSVYINIILNYNRVQNFLYNDNGRSGGQNVGKK